MALLAAACAESTTAPADSLVGDWDFIGFSDAGVAAVTTGTWVFRTDGTFSVAGTITYPSEPTDSIVVAGTFLHRSSTVSLIIGADTTSWTLSADGNDVTLTANEPPPANTINLRRRA